MCKTTHTAKTNISIPIAGAYYICTNRKYIFICDGLDQNSFGTDQRNHRDTPRHMYGLWLVYSASSWLANKDINLFRLGATD